MSTLVCRNCSHNGDKHEERVLAVDVPPFKCGNCVECFPPETQTVPALSVDDLTGLAQIVSNFSEMSTVILEAATGYRAKCVEAGYSETAAEQMSVRYHDEVLGMFMEGVRTAMRQKQQQ